MRWMPGYTESEVRDAVVNSRSQSDARRRLGLRPAGGNFRTLKKLIAFYGVSIDHFDPNCAVGRKYGVSDNAVRKWIRWYRARQGPEAGEEEAA